jgi:hypothetical protein
MSYYIATTLKVPFDRAIELAEAALKEAAAEVRERLRAVVRDLEEKGVEA